MLWIGALYLAASGPLMAQTMGLNASTSLSEPCSSAKAVHDMRCPNYTGFKTRLGGRVPAADLPGRAASDESLSLEGSGLVKRAAIFRAKKMQYWASKSVSWAAKELSL